MIVITVARKCIMGSVTQNALQHGTGGINVGACRIPFSDNEPDSGQNFYRKRDAAMPENRTNYFRGMDGVVKVIPSKIGRWPANFILSETSISGLNRQGMAAAHNGGAVEATRFFKVIKMGGDK